MPDAAPEPIISKKPASTMRRDIVSAYAAAIAKIGSWVVISAILFRHNEEEYAVIAMVRATIGLLNYTTFGLGPAMVRAIAAARRNIQPLPVIPANSNSTTLNYASIPPPSNDAVFAAYSNGVAAAMMSMVIGLLVVAVYAALASYIHRTTTVSSVDLRIIVLALGVGTIFRLISDVSGAILQAAHYISLDNQILISGEVLWVVLGIVCFPTGNITATGIAEAYAISGAIQFFLRWKFAVNVVGRAAPNYKLVNKQFILGLISFGFMVTLAQLADYLYAPSDYILINHLLDPLLVATYAPAVQIDSGLLLLVAGVAAVLLPKTAVAETSGDFDQIKKYYLAGTLYSSAILAIASFAIWAGSSWIFKLWLGNSMPATRAILPLILVHTIVGGSSAVGRSILIGMGKVKPFTIAVLIAGVSNVILSFVFVKFGHLGLRGIVFGTIIAVVGRCAIWMPWYVLRTLGHEVN